MTLREVVEKYPVVEAVHDPAHGSYIIVENSPKALSDPTGISYPEMGYASPSPFLSWTRFEQNPKLAGLQGLREYYNMKRSDGTVRGSLRLFKTPVLAAHWFVEPHDDTSRNQNAADFVWENFSCWLNVSWARLLDDVLLMGDYGYMAFEKVWQEPYGPGDEVRDGKLRLAKLSPRHPLDIQEWVWDVNGGPNGIIMHSNPAPNSSGPLADTRPAPQGPIPIPINKLVVFSYDAEGGDLSGISVLRSAWKHYYYKDNLYKIDAIQKERHGIGIPIIKLPPGFSPTDKSTAEALGRNLRTNEKAHVALPPLWEIAFAKLEGQPVDCMVSISHHDLMIATNILASFMGTTNAHAGSATQTLSDIFFKSTRYLANMVCDTFNKHVIPQLIDANFSRGVRYPYLRARRIGEWEELRTLSFALRNLVGADLIRADDPLEATLRHEFDLPPMDLETARSPVFTQATQATFPAGGLPGDQPPGSPTPPSTTVPKAGPPRQTPPGVSPPTGKGGQDRSGGK